MPLEGHVLGFAADDRERMNDVPLAESRRPLDARVCDQASAPADFHIRADHAVRPDFHVVGDLGAGIDARRVSYQSGHSGFFLSTGKKIGKDDRSSMSIVSSSRPGHGARRGRLAVDGPGSPVSVDHHEPQLSPRRPSRHLPLPRP